MRFVTCAFLILVSANLIESIEQNITELEIVLSLPKAGSDAYFKTLPEIAVSEERDIYAVENREHIVYKFAAPSWDVTKIGRKGEGPGDLLFPSLVSAEGNNVYIKDNIAISQFDSNGKYVNRFRLFQNVITMSAYRGKIFLAQTDRPDLITVYTANGDKVTSFGKKYPVDYSKYASFKWSNSLIDYVVNSGKILISEENIYFVAKNLAEIYIYDQKGNLIKTMRLAKSEWLSEIEDALLRPSKEKSLYPFFSDVALFEHNLFGLVSKKIKQSPGNILKYSEKDMRMNGSYIFPENERKANIFHQNLFVTRGKDSELLFIVSLINQETDDIKINIYREKKISQ